MSTPQSPSPRPSERVTGTRPDPGQASLGALLGEITSNTQKLFRQEIELAKAEMKEEVVKSGKAARMLGGSGFAAYMAVVLGSLAIVFGLANVMDIGWAALIVTMAWAVISAILYVIGRDRLRTVSPKPDHTVETLKEDAQWVRHPTR